MIAYIVTESDFVAALLKRLLTKQERADIEIKNWGMSMYSMARTLIVSRYKPVAVVIEANTPNPKRVAQERQSADQSLWIAAGRLVPYKIIIAVPEIEAVFFQRPEILRRRFDGEVTDHLLELAQYSAHAALGKLAADGDSDKLRKQIFKTLTAEEAAALRQTDLIQEVLEFIAMARQRAQPKAKAGV
jgi:hypothetical protein